MGVVVIPSYFEILQTTEIEYTGIVADVCALTGDIFFAVDNIVTVIDYRYVEWKSFR
jgi:hypothetical protein